MFFNIIYLFYLHIIIVALSTVKPTVKKRHVKVSLTQNVCLNVSLYDTALGISHKQNNLVTLFCCRQLGFNMFHSVAIIVA